MAKVHLTAIARVFGPDAYRITAICTRYWSTRDHAARFGVP